MEIVNIDALTFDMMLSKFESFYKRMEQICSLHGEKSLSDWLDNQDVCLLLNISPRTLQTFRDKGVLAYAQINHKVYYKSSDIEKLLLQKTRSLSERFIDRKQNDGKYRSNIK